MNRINNRAVEIQRVTGLQPRHFADLIRAAQLIFDPTGGVAGLKLDVDWSYFGISDSVAENLQQLGQKYQYASPHIPIDVIWEQLNPETRSWFIESKESLWQLEEAFPTRDED
ncbi:conserved hypothetical protein [Rippkaea orientalis PCC 8801]|uniref:Excinuclease ATPase subunit n=1 Tax=Rippkaea orientalis (strain PCC 8801 / RF-1) TaxID=41431 RepID=B7K1D4_RIPO1|nr:hypothetical protein [Rippkaea orientalis]ACK66329.1 conserved hypothetical protein [Rippkaea orientalis PCC 8801]